MGTGRPRAVQLPPFPIFLGNRTQVTTWLRQHPAPGEGEPDITGVLFLHTRWGDGEVPSRLCPVDPPGHHQHGLASSKHRPGRANGHGPRSAQDIMGNLRRETKRTNEEGRLRWVDRAHQGHQFPGGSNPLCLAPCNSHIYGAGWRRRAWAFLKCPLCARH